MRRGIRLALASPCLAGLLLLAGCHLPGRLSVVADATDARLPGSGSLVLRFALPAPARELLYVPVATTRSVRVTVSGPLYRDPSQPGSPKPLMQTVANANVVVSGTNGVSVTVNNVNAGSNLTVAVDVYDGPLVNGQPSGKLLESLSGLVSVLDGQSTSASLGWSTTPAGQALQTLRQIDDPRRVVATDASALQALVQAMIDTPTPAATHPVFIDGHRLAYALERYTRAQANWPVGKGYAIPPSGDPVLADVTIAAAKAPAVPVYDLRGNAVTSNLKLTIGDPVTAVAGSPPFAFNAIGPGDWWVFLQGLNGETRRASLRKHFAAGGPNELPSLFLSGAATNFAGTGAAGTGTALLPQLNNPHQLAFDGTGNMYIADTGNQRVIKLDALAHLTLVAGTGTPGSLGDGLPATQAQLSAPEGVAVDGAGNIYIADTGNHKIRLVDISGIMHTFAGTGTPGFNGDGTATSQQLNGPTNLAIGGTPDSLFLHDSQNMRIRRIALGASGPNTSITTLAVGNLTAAHTGLAYKTLGGIEYMYYCTFSPPQVIRQTMTGPSLGQRLLLAGGGTAVPPLDEGIPGAQVQTAQVRAIAVDPSGNVAIGDRWSTGPNDGRVHYSNPDLFPGLFTALGSSGNGAFGLGGSPGLESACGLPYGLAFGPTAGAPLYVATGGLDHRVLALAP